MEGFIQKVRKAVQSELGDLYEVTQTEVTKVTDSKTMHLSLMRCYFQMIRL